MSGCGRGRGCGRWLRLEELGEQRGQLGGREEIVASEMVEKAERQTTHSRASFALATRRGRLHLPNELHEHVVEAVLELVLTIGMLRQSDQKSHNVFELSQCEVVDARVLIVVRLEHEPQHVRHAFDQMLVLEALLHKQSKMII